MSKKMFYKAICDASVYRSAMWQDGGIGDSRLPGNLVELSLEVINATKVIDEYFSKKDKNSSNNKSND